MNKVLIAITLFLFGTISFGQVATSIDWQKDLQYLRDELPQLHCDLFFSLSKEVYNAQIDQLFIASQKVSTDEMYIKIQQLLTKIGDSHTRTNYYKLLPQKYLPILTYVYKEGHFITGSMDGNESVLGNKLVSINHHPIQTIIDSVSTLFVSENESWFNSQIPFRMSQIAILKYFGFVTGDKITIQTENYYGIPTEIKVKPFDSETFEEDDLAYMKYSGSKNKRPRSNNIFHQQYFPKDSTYFIVYNQATSRETEQMRAIQDSLNYDSEFVNTCLPVVKKPKKAKKPLPYFRDYRDTILNTIKNQPIKKLVFDLSNNSGGSSNLMSNCIDRMSKIIDTTKTKVYVIVGRKTFSAGLIHAMEVKRKFHATVIGEPTGGKPSFYGGVLSKYLPTCCLQFDYSTSKRVTSKDTDLKNADSLIPDVTFPVTFASKTSGRDPIFEWIMNQK